MIVSTFKSLKNVIKGYFSTKIFFLKAVTSDTLSSDVSLFFLKLRKTVHTELNLRLVSVPS